MVMGELLRRSFEIYLPLVDIGGVDCVIKTDKDMLFVLCEEMKIQIMLIKNFKRSRRKNTASAILRF